MTIEAKFIRHLNDWRSSARLYELSEAVEFVYDLNKKGKTFFVIVSSVNVPYSGDEVLIFPAKPDGTEFSYTEIYGERSTLDHDTAIRNAGWTPVYELSKPLTQRQLDVVKKLAKKSEPITVGKPRILLEKKDD